MTPEAKAYCERMTERIAELETVKLLLFSALIEAENALADYIPTLERNGASLNYGHAVLNTVRAAISVARKAV